MACNVNQMTGETKLIPLTEHLLKKTRQDKTHFTNSHGYKGLWGEAHDILLEPEIHSRFRGENGDHHPASSHVFIIWKRSFTTTY